MRDRERESDARQRARAPAGVCRMRSGTRGNGTCVAACDAATATAKLFRLINNVGCAAECFDWIKLIELVSYIFLGKCLRAELF